MAFHLKTPVHKLVQEMPYEELLGWMSYFEFRPIDWRSDDRTFKLLQAQGVKGKAINIFPSLKAIYQPSSVGSKETVKDGILNPAQFKGTSIFSRMLTAQGGDKLDFGEDDESDGN